MNKTYISSDLNVYCKEWQSSIDVVVSHVDDIVLELTLSHDNFIDFTVLENWEGLRDQIDCDEIYFSLAEDYKLNQWIENHSDKGDLQINKLKALRDINHEY